MKTLEQKLIDHCSPTLASLKTASLFCCHGESYEDIVDHVNKWNKRLGHKGIGFLAWKCYKGHVLLYVFRLSSLQNDLIKPGVLQFLEKYGYLKEDVNQMLEHLAWRLRYQKEFPNEIGLFLGYPLEDVQGFIKNRGRNFKCSGCWKVYGTQEKVQEQFRRFKECRRNYIQHWEAGMTLDQLIIHT